MTWSRGVAGLVVAVAMVTCGCTATVPGRAVAPATGAAPTTSADPSAPGGAKPCDDITYSDPTIAFESAVADGAQLEVGETGWINGTGSVADIQVSGDPGTVGLAERSAPTQIACGTVTGSVSWIEVIARRPGTVVITVAGDTDTIRVTVR